MQRFRVTALIICLLLAQSALLAHQLDLSAHSDGQTCEYCALTGSLDKPVADIAISFRLTSDAVEAQPLISPVVLVRTLTFNARAPPLFS